MKKKIMLLAFVAICIAVQLQAQESSAKKSTAGWDLATMKGGRCVISPTTEGCALSFTFQKIEMESKSERNEASGKRQHRPIYIVKSFDNSVTEAKNPGKLSASRAAFSDKSTMQDISVTLSCSGRLRKLPVVDGEFTLPDDCNDGDHDLVCSWSWGVTNSGSGKRCVVTFSVTQQDGVFMAINVKGTGTGH